jgi:hypothetical protein
METSWINWRLRRGKFCFCERFSRLIQAQLISRGLRDSTLLALVNLTVNNFLHPKFPLIVHLKRVLSTFTSFTHSLEMSMKRIIFHEIFSFLNSQKRQHLTVICDWYPSDVSWWIKREELYAILHKKSFFRMMWKRNLIFLYHFVVKRNFHFVSLQQSRLEN